MKRKILFIALFAMTSSAFAKEVENTNQKEVLLPLIKYCRTANATNEDGEIVASATCCRSFATQPTPIQEVGILTQLQNCADEALELSLSTQP